MATGTVVDYVPPMTMARILSVFCYSDSKCECGTSAKFSAVHRGQILPFTFALVLLSGTYPPPLSREFPNVEMYLA